jgi:prevent-host-death family protein
MAETREFGAGEARDHFADILNEAAYGETRTVLRRHSKRVAAVVPIADFDVLNELERLIDVEMAKAALEEAKVKGTIPLEEFLAKLEARPD